MMKRSMRRMTAFVAGMKDGEVEAKIRALVPGYMAMGADGMARHAEHAEHKHHEGP